MRREVLFVDDNTAFLNSVQIALNLRGLEADFANSWDRALSLFRIGLHELVIADYNLPGSKLGLKLLLEIKHLRPSSRLILISGALTPEAKNLVLQTGLVDEFFPKGQEVFDQLLEEIQNAVRSASGPSDWASIAKSHISHAEIDAKLLEEIDVLLSTQINGGN